MKNWRYLKTSEAGVWTYCVAAWEREWARAGIAGVEHQRWAGVRMAARVLAKLGLVRNLRPQTSPNYLVALMGPAEYRLFPISYNHRVAVYAYDCWPANYERWEKFLRRNRVAVAFFTARQSAEHFMARLPQMQSIWLPEATAAADYCGDRPLATRTIDVLELGRKHAAYHAAVTEGLRQLGCRHLYEQRKGELIFATKEELSAGLGDAKVSICFPGSVTDPARCGAVETLTHRYLESMASRCIVLGQAPRELIDLFGYDPVVPADWERPVEQLEYMLSHLDEFIDLVERNYCRLLEVGTWQVRLHQMLRVLNEEGRA